ncbi:helix-turn-helix transcriptional regulator [Oscillatoria sp. FACHB-1407]|uniref:helix-turn-helix transcriptional regulator n=1 Tax=Oscillatoria sp. FACHB-1407 TaxID=2692847 RepID=UPI0016830898|nr:LuxR C-terminal-related transcriptional regulator [Oscillatoria sp. FACHB-1407]MBD2461323.1 helix-turn-helix transcriptional regulator [Oscillatoria sp. FACHB-1407]
MNKLINTSKQTPSISQSSVSLSVLQAEVQLATQTQNAVLFQSNKSTGLLLSVLESLMDGVLLLTDKGKLVNANNYALQICHQFMQDRSSTTQVPQQIWRICEALIDSRDHYPDRIVTIEDEIDIGKTSVIRIRARWVEIEDANRPYLLVMLEDRSQSLKDAVIAEARKYNLTPREAEVWLLRRANCTYKAIAAELHIAIDTVKKHVKSINAKRDAFLWANE